MFLISAKSIVSTLVSITSIPVGVVALKNHLLKNERMEKDMNHIFNPFESMNIEGFNPEWKKKVIVRDTYRLEDTSPNLNLPTTFDFTEIYKIGLPGM